MVTRARRRFFRRWRRHRLAEKLRDYPLIRLLVFKRWFRLAFAVVILLGVFLGLFLPKIWLVTPRNFNPKIKISGLDLVQAWSLKRTALRAMTAGQYDLANHAWQAAIANNPANPNLVRGFLENARRSDRLKFNLPQVIGQAFWLLRLSGEQETDLELAAQILEKFHEEGLLLGLLEPRSSGLNPALQKAYAKALFNSGHIELFAQRWEQFQNEWATDRELRLYHAAYLAGWDASPMASKGRQMLEQENDPTLQDLGCRLQMAASANLRDPERYAKSLNLQIDRQADTASDHAIYWRLLLTCGRKAEAVKLAQSYAKPPRSALDVVRLGEVLAQLGLREEARQFIKRYLAEFGHSEELWQTYANVLIEDHQWELLQALALQIRQESPVRESLEGYGYYLEGKAQLEQDRRPLAEEAFGQAVRAEYGNPALGVLVAENLMKSGFAPLAGELLSRFQKRFDQDANYWFLAFNLAYELKQPERLLESAGKAYRLRPQDFKFVNNYAAALLVLRQQPDEAIKLTWQLMSTMPDSIAAKINHSIALLMNRRTEEAESLLKSILPERLTPPEANSFYLAWYEVYINHQRWDDARRAGARLRTEFLFPNQVKWLEQNRPPTTSKG